MSPESEPSTARQEPERFPQTRWSMVLGAQSDDPAALAELCRLYWFPLYCFARRIRPDQEDAKDLTQGFFEMLLSRQTLKTVCEERGKLRSFLLAALKNYAASHYRRERRIKRGGGVAVLQLDAMEAEERFACEPREELTPEREFDRAWARQLLSGVLERLGAAYQEAGKGDVFSALQDQLAGGGSDSYEAAGRTLGWTPAAVRFAAFKLRERYRQMLREAINETVTSPEEAEEELAHLREIFN